MSMFKDIPVDVGVIYEGERIRRNDMQVELGGPTVKEKFELAKVKPLDQIEDGKITNREMRSKLGHNQFASEPHEEHHGESHGQDPASHNKHVQMANSIADCQVLLCGGVGMGAYLSMQQLNIQPIVTDYQDVEGAVQAYIDGKIKDHTEKLH